jgi:hypothetical protein
MSNMRRSDCRRAQGPASATRRHGVNARRTGAQPVLVVSRSVGPLGLVVLGQPLLEAFDALGHVAHDGRDAPAAAKKEKRDKREDEQMPAAQAHRRSLLC